MSDYFAKPFGLEMLAAVLVRGLPAEAKTTLLKNERSCSGSNGVENESESALCKKTLQGLRELGSDMGTSFFPELLETFEHYAAEHLAALRLAIAGGETGRLRGEAHALKGASLTIGAHRMADICQQLESLGTTQSLVGAPEGLARLDREFGRVKDEIKQERLFPFENPHRGR